LKTQGFGGSDNMFGIVLDQVFKFDTRSTRLA